MFFKKDIYKALRPDTGDIFFGTKFKRISTISYKDALIYPRFKFLMADSKLMDDGIFETSDYQKLLEIIGNVQLSVGSKIEYESKLYEISDVSIAILDIVIDYSNGHTDYYIGEPIPFHLEITILLKDISILDIAIEASEKYGKLKSLKSLDFAEDLILSSHKEEAERCFSILLSSGITDESIYQLYALFKSECDEHEEAIELFSEALKLNPLSDEINFYPGS